jgi:hypothetical protein
MLAPEIFPAPAPLRMTGGGAAAPGAALGVSGGSSGAGSSAGGGFGGGFAAWGGGGGGGLPPWQTEAPQAPAGQISAPQVPGLPFLQTVPVVWVASSGAPFFMPSLTIPASPAPGGAPAPTSSAPVSTSSSLTPVAPFVPAGGTFAIGTPPEIPGSGEGGPPADVNGGNGDSSGQPSGAQPQETPPNSPQPDQLPEGRETPQYTPEPGTGLLALAGALAAAGWAAFRNRRIRSR